MANIKFTEFPSATVVGSMDIIPIVQDGANKKTTASVFSTYIGTLFVNLSGTQTITGSKTFSSQLISSVATGTAPFTVASTTKVTNLNADLLDGLSSAAFQTVLTNPITGTGTTNYLPKFTGASALGNSLLQETTNAIGLNVTPKAWGNNNKVLETTFSTSLIGRSDFSALGRNFFYNSGDDPIYSNNGFASGYFQADGEHLWVSAASGTAGNTISFAQTMTLKANGNVGIGTTTPLAILDVFQTGQPQLRVRGTAGANHLYQDSITGTSVSDGLFVGIGSDQVGYVFQYEAKDLAFGTNTTERMRIFSDGNIAINSTTNAGYKLDVNGTARVGAFTAAKGIFQSSTGETLTAQGTAGNWVANLSGSASTSNSYGLLVEAGTNSSDLALGIYSKSFAATLLTIKGDGVATFGGKVNIGNPVTAGVAVASTHKVEIVIGGTTYYLLATT